jgi:RNA recognition motif-containing protein
MNIYVGNLSYEVTEDELRQEFSAFGEVTSVTIVKDNYSGQSKGFGFVEMPKLQEGQAAIAGLNEKKLKDRSIVVNGARPKGDTGSRRGVNRSGGKGGYGKKKNNFGSRGGFRRY